MNLNLFYLCLFFSTLCLADIKSDFEKIKNFGHNLQKAGTVCEDLAFIYFKENYKEPTYTVMSGVEYIGEYGVIGELDVIVKDNRIQKIISVTEVKCWRTPESAFTVYNNQKNRLIHTLKTEPLVFRLAGTNTYITDHIYFDDNFKMTSLGQKDTRQYGFDFELEYNLKQLDELKDMVSNCQAKNKCKRPYKKTLQ